MKKLFKILKLILATLLAGYSIVVIYMLLFSAPEKRYSFAAHLQGSELSQKMFEILKFQDPENDRIYFEQSVPFNKRGYYEEGFKLLDQAVALQPEMHLGYRGYMKLRFLRNFNGALADFNRLDSLTPGVIDTPWGEDIDFLRGESYYGLEDYQAASKHFKKSIGNQGEDWADIQSFVYIGICEYELGNLEEAINYYKKALKQSKYSVEAHLGLAKIYSQNGKTELAKSHLEKAGKYFNYKRKDPYTEYLNEIYKSDLVLVKNSSV